MTNKDLEWILTYCRGICLEDLTKATTNLGQDGQRLSRNSNCAPTEGTSTILQMHQPVR